MKIGNNTSVQDAAHIGVEGAAVVLGDDVVVCTCRCPSWCSRPGHSFTRCAVCCPLLLFPASSCAAPGARVVSATVESGARIGMGAHVLPGAVVGKNAFVDAGAVVGRGVRVPEGEVWTGNPARKLRSLTAEELAFLRSSAACTAKVRPSIRARSECFVVECRAVCSRVHLGFCRVCRAASAPCFYFW